MKKLVNVEYSDLTLRMKLLNNRTDTCPVILSRTLGADLKAKTIAARRKLEGRTFTKRH